MLCAREERTAALTLLKCLFPWWQKPDLPERRSIGALQTAPPGPSKVSNHCDSVSVAGEAHAVAEPGTQRLPARWPDGVEAEVQRGQAPEAGRPGQGPGAFVLDEVAGQH